MRFSFVYDAHTVSVQARWLQSAFVLIVTLGLIQRTFTHVMCSIAGLVQVVTLLSSILFLYCCRLAFLPLWLRKHILFELFTPK